MLTLFLIVYSYSQANIDQTKIFLSPINNEDSNSFIRRDVGTDDQRGRDRLKISSHIADWNKMEDNTDMERNADHTHTLSETEVKVSIVFLQTEKH